MESILHGDLKSNDVEFSLEKSWITFDLHFYWKVF